MKLGSILDRLHAQAKQNWWLRCFALFNRLALAVGFGIAGAVKIMGERFASGLSAVHPMGRYLEALYYTGAYYTFVGVSQVMAAILLLIPRTVTLGAVLYFPIILNICVLSLAVRFDGSLISSPLMLLANLYLLCWDYDKLKYILPFGEPPPVAATLGPTEVTRAFPIKFFGGVVAAIALVVLVVTQAYNVMPRNSFADCKRQFAGTARTTAGAAFCACIHKQGVLLDTALAAYYKAPDDGARAVRR